MSRALAILPLFLACAHAGVPDRDQLHAQIGNVGADRELAVSLFVSPFFRDDSRRLLTVHAPTETELLVSPRGKPILPGDVEEILAAGTRVTVLAVEFPSAWADMTRPLLTPKARTWVELAIAGRKTKPAYVLALRPDLATLADVESELSKWLAPRGLAQEVAALPGVDQAVVKAKTTIPGASPRALELAFGKPSLRRIFGEGDDVMEEWTWRSDLGSRGVTLRNGVVESTREKLPITVAGR